MLTLTPGSSAAALVRPYDVPGPMLPTDDVDAFLRAAGGGAVFCGRKHDGVHCRSVASGAGQLHLSRGGIRFPNFDVFDAEAERLQDELARLSGHGQIVLDGEACDASGRFQDILGDLRRQRDADTSGFVLHAFDWRPLHNAQPLPYAERRALLRAAAARALSGSGRVRLAQDEQIGPCTAKSLARLLRKALAAGWEGIVLKAGSSLYEPGESASWLRLKGVRTMDLPVLELGQGRTELAGHAVRFLCRLPGGRTVGVGPGAAPRAELRRIWELWEREGALPRLIEVAYKEETRNGSLREPRFVRVRDDKV